MPTTENEPLPWYRDEFRASQRASEDRRDVAFRVRRRRLRGRASAAVLFASLTVMVGAAAAYFAAVAGGDHRDRNVPFRTFGR